MTEPATNTPPAIPGLAAETVAAQPDTIASLCTRIVELWTNTTSCGDRDAPIRVLDARDMRAALEATLRDPWAPDVSIGGVTPRAIVGSLSRVVPGIVDEVRAEWERMRYAEPSSPAAAQQTETAALLHSWLLRYDRRSAFPIRGERDPVTGMIVREVVGWKTDMFVFIAEDLSVQWYARVPLSAAQRRAIQRLEVIDSEAESLVPSTWRRHDGSCTTCARTGRVQAGKPCNHWMRRQCEQFNRRPFECLLGPHRRRNRHARLAAARLVGQGILVAFDSDTTTAAEVADIDVRLADLATSTNGRNYVSTLVTSALLVGLVLASIFCVRELLLPCGASDQACFVAPKLNADGVGFVLDLSLAFCWGWIGAAWSSLQKRRELDQRRFIALSVLHGEALARGIVGALGGVAAILTLRCGILPLAIGPHDAPGSELVAFSVLVAFAAGYSERLMPSTIESLSRGDGANPTGTTTRPNVAGA